MTDRGAILARGADAGRLPGLSRRAVAEVATLGLGDAEQIADRLYCFHRIPWTPRWSATLPDPALLLASARGWRRPIPVRDAGGWLALSRDDARAQGPRSRFDYKLYLSPMPEAVAEVIPLAAEAAVRAGTVRFKVGADPVGLLRPDKIVFYLYDAAELSALAEELVQALAGMPAHGVPFTAPLTYDGLLSWAGDPPGAERESWRLAICRLLGRELARGASVDEAMSSLAGDGVLLPSFAPAALEPPVVLRRVA